MDWLEKVILLLGTLEGGLIFVFVFLLGMMVFDGGGSHIVTTSNYIGMAIAFGVGLIPGHLITRELLA